MEVGGVREGGRDGEDDRDDDNEKGQEEGSPKFVLFARGFPSHTHTQGSSTFIRPHTFIVLLGRKAY